MRNCSYPTLLIVALFAHDAKAQVEFGLKAGANGSAFVLDYMPKEQFSFDMRQIESNMEPHQGDLLPDAGRRVQMEDGKGWGYGFGAYMDAQVFETFHIRLEALYALRSVSGDFISYTNVQLPIAYDVQGWKAYEATTASGSYRQDLGYLEVPLLASFPLVSGRVEFGVAGGFLLGGRTNFRGEVSSISWRERHTTDGYTVAELLLQRTDNPYDVSMSGKDATKGMNSLEWAVLAGVELPLSNTLTWGLRYWHGASSVHVSSPDAEGSERASFNRVIQMTIGFVLSGANGTASSTGAGAAPAP
ncbi:MAG: outer membrane beta-barrel protein [Flavobacteriales bacterium]|nr:outer membrane beta-barrel protein [Flavobacteriales bacterium]